MTNHRAPLRRGYAALAVLALAASPTLPALAQEAPPPQEAPPSAPVPTVPGRPGPDGTPPEAVILPEEEEGNRVFSGSPLTTGTQPEDTATTTEVPVNPGIDGDAPSEGLPDPAYGELPPGVEPPPDAGSPQGPLPGQDQVEERGGAAPAGSAPDGE